MLDAGKSEGSGGKALGTLKSIGDNSQNKMEPMINTISLLLILNQFKLADKNLVT